MKLFKIFMLLIAFSSAANAENADFAVVQNFAADLTVKNYDHAAQYLTAGSNDLFQKYKTYDLGAMTPGNLQLKSTATNGNFRYLKVAGTSTTSTKPSNIKVAMTTENNTPKIDLPETLKLGFGPNWKQRVAMLEQSYSFAKQNFGDAQSMQMLGTMLKKQ